MKKMSLIGKIILGNLCIALAVNLFILPLNLISGGSTGLVLTLQRLSGWDFAFLTAVVNIITFLVGLLVLGKRFAWTTLVSTIIYPILVRLTALAVDGLILTEEHLLAAIFAGALMGGGLGLVIGAGASTGGMDIPVIIMNRKLGISVSVAMYAMDTLILLSQMAFSPLKMLFYGLILVASTSLTINQVLLVGKSAFQVLVVSEAYEPIRQAILKELDSGVTLVQIETGYLGQMQNAVLCVISSRQLHAVQEKILSLDPRAFMTISKIQEVHGRGFSLAKKGEI